MSSRLQLDVRNLSLWRRHLVNAYEVKAGIGVIAGKTVWSMPERLACTTKISATLTFTFHLWVFNYWQWDNESLLSRVSSIHHPVTLGWFELSSRRLIWVRVDFGFEFVWVRVGIAFGLTSVRVGVGYELNYHHHHLFEQNEQKQSK